MVMIADSFLTDELNTFYVCFDAECNSTSLPTSATEGSNAVSDDSEITVLEYKISWCVLFHLH